MQDLVSLEIQGLLIREPMQYQRCCIADLFLREHKSAIGLTNIATSATAASRTNGIICLAVFLLIIVVCF